MLRRNRCRCALYLTMPCTKLISRTNLSPVPCFSEEYAHKHCKQGCPAVSRPWAARKACRCKHPICHCLPKSLPQRIACVPLTSSFAASHTVHANAGQGYIWLAHRQPNSAGWAIAQRSKMLWESMIDAAEKPARNGHRRKRLGSKADIEWQVHVHACSMCGEHLTLQLHVPL